MNVPARAFPLPSRGDEPLERAARGRRVPTTYTILFWLIATAAAATWIIPAGQYDRQRDVALDRDVPVPGTYHRIDANRQGLRDVLIAPIAGFYDPENGSARAIDVALFVLIIGGFLAIVTRTGAIDAGIGATMAELKGREKWMIPLLMALFAAGGTIYGMAEETLAFYALIVPVMIAAGYDALTGVAIIMLGAGIGTLGSTINPFTTVIASNAAGVPFTAGMPLRFVILGLGWIACAAYVFRYAERVRRDPSQSLVADLTAANRDHLEAGSASGTPPLTELRKVVLFVFALSFLIMVWGVAVAGWWMTEMSAMFLASSIVVAIIARMTEEETTTTFVNGARDLLGVALIIGLVRGIVVVMDAGRITDTVLFWSEHAVRGLGTFAFVNMMFAVQLVLSFFVPSSSGLAVLTMPILAPLADAAKVSRDLVVTTYQSASGLMNLVNPTFAVVLGGLTIGRVPYNRWLRFMWPLLLILTVIVATALSVAA